MTLVKIEHCTLCLKNALGNAISIPANRRSEKGGIPLLIGKSIVKTQDDISRLIDPVRHYQTNNPGAVVTYGNRDSGIVKKEIQASMPFCVNHIKVTQFWKYLDNGFTNSHDLNHLFLYPKRYQQAGGQLNGGIAG
jgi:hypothetical protein